MLQGKKILFVFMAIGILLCAMGTVQAAPTDASVGYVDYLYLINHHPDTSSANEALKAERDQDKQQYDEKSAALSDPDKQALAKQLNQQVEQKRQELLKPIAEKINAAIKEVADEKGLSIVISKNNVIYGGVDITADVLQKIGGK
ncbi:MAG: OmpH family outer membrane protein [Veillonellales bacterium]